MNCEQLHTITYKARLLSQEIRRLFDTNFEKLGITGQQGRILIFVYKNKSVHQNDIEQQFGLSKSTVSGIIKRMQKKDIITKQSDYPFVTIKPTQKANELIEKMDEIKNKINNQLLKGFTEEEKEKMNINIDRLIENAKEGIE